MNRTPYVEYTPEWYIRWQHRLKVDDAAKHELVNIIFKTRPLTLLLLLCAIGGAAFLAFMAALR